MAQTKEENTLVSTGWSSWLNSEFHQEVRRLHMEERVFITGHIPAKELVLLYNSASMMVYPSLYEGFGLPILEAMACDCLVICCNTSGMPEVAGDTAILVSPEDEEDIAEAIDKIMMDEELSQQLTESGYIRAKEFNWETTAQQTLSIFEQVRRT